MECNSFVTLAYLGNHALKGLARTTLGKIGSTISNHIGYLGCPTDGCGELGNKISLNLFGVSMGLGIYIPFSSG